MIIREWRGRASELKADAYPKHFREAVVPELRNVPGFLGAHLSRRRIGDRIEYLVLTRWQSMDAIRAFAGVTVDRAVVQPQAVAALDDFDASVQHYEVIEELSGACPSQSARWGGAALAGVD
jgi:heme-degrading monooxygenase HmoA